MIFEKEKIEEALKYYSIKDNNYKEKCNKCINEITKDEKIYKKANEIYEILYIDKTGKLIELWKEKDINLLFGEKVNPFITNVLLLLGYEYHKENIKKYKCIFSHFIFRKSYPIKNKFFKKLITHHFPIILI